MSETFLRADGLVELRPDPAAVAEATRTGVDLVTRGELCTACLVGDWGLSLLRVAKTLCDDCTWLEAEVSRRAGAARSRAGRTAGDGDVQLAGLSDPDDASWAPVRAALQLRDARLTELLDDAAASGMAVVELDSVRDHDRTVRAVSRQDALRSGLLDDSAEARVRLFAEWLRLLAPEDHAVRADVLADVPALAHALRAHQVGVMAASARADVDRVGRETARALATVTRAPLALGAVVSRLVRVRLTRFARAARA